MRCPRPTHLRPLAAALLLAGALASCTQTSSTQELRQDYVALKTALESYARANGAYPEQLAQLAQPDRRGKTHLADPAQLTDPFGNEYVYTPPEGARPAVLESRGEGVDGTSIDLAQVARASR